MDAGLKRRKSASETARRTVGRERTGSDKLKLMVTSRVAIVDGSERRTVDFEAPESPA